MKIVEELNNGLPDSYRDGSRLFKEAPSGILLHAMARELEGLFAPDWLEKVYDDLRSSAHYFIDYDGTIYQRVANNVRANHAGTSHHLGLDSLNNHYIGIELLVRGAANKTYGFFKRYINQGDGGQL